MRRGRQVVPKARCKIAYIAITAIKQELGQALPGLYGRHGPPVSTSYSTAR
jgi:hypothetical protein